MYGVIGAAESATTIAELLGSDGEPGAARGGLTLAPWQVKCCDSTPWLNTALVTVMVDGASGVRPVLLATPHPVSRASPAARATRGNRLTCPSPLPFTRWPI